MVISKIDRGELLYHEKTSENSEVVQLKRILVIGYILLILSAPLTQLPQTRIEDRLSEIVSIGGYGFVITIIVYVTLSIFSLADLRVFSTGFIAPNRGIINWLMERDRFVKFGDIDLWRIHPKYIEFQLSNNSRYRLPFWLVRKGRFIPLIKANIKNEPLSD